MRPAGGRERESKTHLSHSENRREREQGDSTAHSRTTHGRTPHCIAHSRGPLFFLFIVPVLCSLSSSFLPFFIPSSPLPPFAPLLLPFLHSFLIYSTHNPLSSPLPLVPDYSAAIFAQSFILHQPTQQFLPQWNSLPEPVLFSATPPRRPCDRSRTSPQRPPPTVSSVWPSSAPSWARP